MAARVPAPAPILPPSDPASVFAWSATAFAGTPAATLFTLDRQLGDIVRTTTQPMMGQLRLAWWRDALTTLGAAPPPAHPLLVALALFAEPASLAAMADGWELLLGEEMGDDLLAEYARLRGGTLFQAVASTLGVAPPRAAEAGAGWALADLAAHVGEARLRARAQALAAAALEDALSARWGEGRVLAGLARDALLGVRGQGAPGGPRRAAAVLRVMLAGR